MEDMEESSDHFACVYESLWGLEVISYFQSQMINFGIRKVHFNIDQLNQFCQDTNTVREFFDCSLETLDGNHSLKNPDFQNHGTEIPFNYRAR